MCWYTDPLLKTCRHIVIKDIQKNISIGAYEHEMHGKQPVIINVEVFVQTENEKDQLDNAYNYDEDTSDLVLKDNINAGYNVAKRVSDMVNPDMIKSNKIYV